MFRKLLFGNGFCREEVPGEGGEGGGGTGEGGAPDVNLGGGEGETGGGSVAISEPDAGDGGAIPQGGEGGEPEPSSSAEPVKDVFPDLEHYATELPEGVKADAVDADLVKAFRSAAHEAKVPEDAFKSVLGKMLEYNAKVEKDIEVARHEMAKENSNQLRAEYGLKFAGMQELANNTLVNLAAEAGIDDLSVFNLPEVQSNPSVFKLFVHIGNMLKEGGFAQSKAPEIVNAQQELDAINGDPSNPYYAAYHDINHPGYEKANKRVNYLYEQLMR